MSDDRRDDSGVDSEQAREAPGGGPLDPAGDAGRRSEQAGDTAVRHAVDSQLLDDLASNLLWRIGRVADDGPVTVRVGMASSAPLFQELPRLRSASDAEVEAAIQEGSLRVEWVGPRPRGER